MPIPLGVLAVAGAGAAPSGPGAYELLETQVLTGTQATITFSNLISSYSSTYQHLQIRMVTRGNRSGAEDSNVYIQFNSSAGTNYNSHYLRGNGSATESVAYTSSNNAGIFLSQANTGATQTANSFAVSIVDILDPFETSKFTTVRTLAGMTGALNRIFLHSGAWRVTDAVDTITIDDTLGDFTQYSRFSLYGMRSVNP
jgi:hypothetical protein